MNQPADKSAIRIVSPPVTGNANALPQVGNVALQADEEVRWIWTCYPDGRRVVTGYEILKAAEPEQRAA